ncbi:MAG: hypothetical protein HFH19_07845, partial [Ruminococcus sp.]|nr:hypothetical protein [Ruminococcus sp.]
MTFQDIFKSSFLENVDSVSIVDMALAMILAFGIDDAMSSPTRALGFLYSCYG